MTNKEELREKVRDVVYKHLESRYILEDGEDALKVAVDVMHLIDEQIRAARTEIVEKLQEKLEEAERNGKNITVRNRAKWARDNETLGESYARNQGFKSGILVAQRVVDTLSKDKDNHDS